MAMPKRSHSLALKSDGQLWSWGRNDSGELGINLAITKRSSPVSVVGEHTFIRIQTGVQFSLALKSNGECWSWGRNGYGQLGDNTAPSDGPDSANKSSPVSVVGDHTFTAISAGRLHSLALKSNGQCWAWGDNTYGPLGDNTSSPPADGGAENKSSPISVVGNHAFIAISGGNSYSLALKANGEAWSWGLNDIGQLGQNNLTHRSSPVSVVGNHAFIAISAGDAHALALKSNGQVWSWGMNGATSGELGDNTTDGRSSPVSVVGDHMFIAISSGQFYSLALKSNGSVWSWGDNNVGQLGDSTTDRRSSPVSVVGNHSFIRISAGQAHSLALKANGECWSWGLNEDGQDGDNTMTYRSSPVLVVGNHIFTELFNDNREGAKHKTYSRGDLPTLPTDDAELSVTFTSSDYVKVATEDNIYVDQEGKPYSLFLFKNPKNIITVFSVGCIGKSNIDASVAPIYLQIYNHDTSSWETLDSDNVTTAGSKFNLSGSKSSDLSNYYADGYVTCRVYQGAVS